MQEIVFTFQACYSTTNFLILTYIWMALLTICYFPTAFQFFFMLKKYSMFPPSFLPQPSAFCSTTPTIVNQYSQAFMMPMEQKHLFVELWMEPKLYATNHCFQNLICSHTSSKAKDSLSCSPPSPYITCNWAVLFIFGTFATSSPS